MAFRAGDASEGLRAAAGVRAAEPDAAGGNRSRYGRVAQLAGIAIAKQPVASAGRRHSKYAMAGVEVDESNRPKDLILVVEDEALIRMHSAEMIKDLGFDVFEAVDADEAVSLLESVH